MQRNRAALQAKFETGDFPTGQDFYDWLDSCILNTDRYINSLGGTPFIDTQSRQFLDSELDIALVIDGRFLIGQQSTAVLSWFGANDTPLGSGYDPGMYLRGESRLYLSANKLDNDYSEAQPTMINYGSPTLVVSEATNTIVLGYPGRWWIVRDDAGNKWCIPGYRVTT